MAQTAVDREAVSCLICLDLLTDPTSIPCGHSFCMTCILQHWNSQKRNSCPQCRKSFRRRPALVKNFTLAGLVEQLKSGLTAPPADRHYAGAQDVPCDVCIGRKLKATRSCLQCLVSFCDGHLRPHRDVAVLQKHQLVAPSAHLQESLCPRHNRAFEMFCRTDQQLLCPLCVDQHRGHDAVSSASGTALKKAQLSALRTLQLQSLQDKRSDLDRLRQEAQDVGRSALAALRSTGDVFTEMVLLLEKRRSEVEQWIRSEEQTRLRRVRELQDRLQRDVTELKKDISELDALSLIEDHNQFLLHCPPLSTQRTHTARTRTGSQLHFDKVSTAVSALRDKLKLTLEEDLTNISLSLSDEPSTSEDFTPLNISPSLSDEPSHREDFLQYYSPITLDPNTAHKQLVLSEGNRRVTILREDQGYPAHEERFVCRQVLGRQSLTGRCYWELEHSGDWICVAVSYRDIQRKEGSQTLFGHNNKSLALHRNKNKYSLLSQGVQTPIPGPVGSRVGVFLDHGAGVVSFYRVSENMRLIHRVHTTFTQPLFAGVCLSHAAPGDTALFHKLK